MNERNTVCAEINDRQTYYCKPVLPIPKSGILGGPGVEKAEFGIAYVERMRPDYYIKLISLA
jgi:hypothetical protein